MSGSYRKVLLALKKEDKRYLDEALSLLATLGIDGVDTIYVKKPNHRYYIQQNLVEKMASDGDKPDLVVVYDKLKPWQSYNLSKDLGCEVWDLVTLLLKIFEIHAGSREAKLQIELTETRHKIPLVKEYVRMAKLGEQAGFMGPGAYGYESLLRSLKRKEVRISRELDEIKRRRERLVLSRNRMGYPHIAIIGYTCAGKTTLYNALTGDDKPTGPQPFKTLMPKSRAGETPCGRIIFTDTMGFVRKMPSEIVEVFHAVISEITAADGLIFVIDALDPPEEVVEKVEAALEILEKINARDKPMVVALNKIDAAEKLEVEWLAGLVRGVMEARGFKPGFFKAISASKRINIDELLIAVCSSIGISDIYASTRFHDQV
ncbi:MAG TPA: GTPase [Sulfolobales archaeon]|nr:GTPase [Sulfolobales archaeon]